MQFLLVQQLRSHEAALKPVVRAFMAVDLAGNGYLDRGQFGCFCTIVNQAVPEEAVAMLWTVLDPGGCGRVTFSTCAHTLSNELTRITKSLDTP